MKGLGECSNLMLRNKTTGEEIACQISSSITRLTNEKTKEAKVVLWNKNCSFELKPCTKGKELLSIIKQCKGDCITSFNSNVPYKYLKDHLEFINKLKSNGIIKHLEIQHVRKSDNKRIQKKIDKKSGYKIYMQLVGEIIENQNNNESEIKFNISNK